MIKILGTTTRQRTDLSDDPWELSVRFCYKGGPKEEFSVLIDQDSVKSYGR